MKKIFLGLFSVALLASCAGDQKSGTDEGAAKKEKVKQAAPTTYTLNAAESNVRWSCEMFGIKEHYGSIDIADGSLTVENGAVTGGTINVNMGTISPADSAYTAEQTKEMLVGHLSSPDFFNVAEFPMATFTVTGMDGNTIMGDLTVRGKTNPESVTDVTMTEKDGVLTASGNLTFDRQKYDVAYDTGAKDFVISDDINLQISISGK